MHTYTVSALRTLDIAIRFSDSADDGYIGTEHLLFGLLSAVTENGTPSIAAKLLSSRGITAAAVSAALHPTAREFLTENSTIDDITDRISAAEQHFTPVLRRILSRAGEEAERFRLAPDGQGAEIGSEHLLFSLLCETDAAAHHLIAGQNLPLHELYGDVLSFLSAVTAEEAIFSSVGEDTADEDIKSAAYARGDDKERADTMPVYLLDMTEQAAASKYDAVVGREAEEEAVLRILLHRQKNNPCLLGEAGVGKTAIVEGLAARIARGAVPHTLSGARILSVDLGAMLAGAKYRGEFEDRLRRVLLFCRAQTTAVILFIDEVHMLMGAGAAEGTVDAANLLKPALSRGEVRVIGATTRTEYDKSIGRDGAMSRRFQAVFVEEPDEAAACAMIAALRPKLQMHHGVQIPDTAIACAVSVSVRCLPDYFLPDKAIDLLDDACAAHKAAQTHAENRQSAEKQRDDALLSGDLAAAQNAVRAASDDDSTPPDLAEHPTVTEQDILLAARRRTGIDLTEERDGKRYDTLGAHLHSTIFGQAEAIDAVTDALRRHSADLTDRPTPISFLFYGPGGVGKTAVCEAVAAHLFDSSHAFLRFDMSEYREAHTVSRLIGAPPGYIGHDDGGLLTTAVRHRPYALILFDGIAHAHPDVVRLITQILDRGTLTDSRGNHVSFRHTVVVLTADTEAASPARTPGFTANTEQTRLPPPKELVSAELLSLIDAVIPFRPLDESVFAQILQSQLDALAKRLGERGITLHCDPTLLPFLLRRIPENRGTRGARRIAAQLTEQPIAQALLDKTLRRGDCVRLAPQNDMVVIVPEQGSSPH